MTVIDLGLPELGGLDDVPTTDAPQKAKDYKSDQEVRWCPGCGDYIVLNTMQSFLPTLGLKPAYAFALSRIGGQDLQHTPAGIFRQIQRTTYVDAARAQIAQATEAKPADLQSLLRGNDTWTVARVPTSHK